MKKSLEYKVLKYLSDNDNSKYLVVNKLHDDKNKLKRVLVALNKEKYIDSYNKHIGNGKDEYLAKIEFNGLKYLESLKPKPLTLYQWIHIGLTFISLIAVITLGCLNYFLNQDKSYLTKQNTQLNSNIVRYKDSINAYKEKALLEKQKALRDTIQSIH